MATKHSTPSGSQKVGPLWITILALASLACGDASFGNIDDPPITGECADGGDPRTWFGDGDDDGFGNPDISVLDCEPPPGFVADATDCNDQVKEINPGARDICGDTIDNDCANGDFCQSVVLAHWVFDEGGGTSAADSTGNGFVGVLRNGAAFIPGAGGIGIEFDGSDGEHDFVEVDHDDAFLLDEGTVSLWFRIDTLTPDEDNADARIGLWSKDSGGLDTGGHLSFWVEATGHPVMRLQAIDELTPAESEISADNPISIDQWHHLAGSFGPDGVHLYIDGVAVKSDPSYTRGMGATSGGIGNREPLAIGALTRSSGNLTVLDTSAPLTGDIADVRVFSRALRLEDAADLFSLTAPQ